MSTFTFGTDDGTFGGAYAFAPAATSVQLELGGAFLDLDNHPAGWVVRAVDLGHPQVREVVSDRPDSDGVDDRTAFVGGRAVSVDLSLSGPDRQLQLDHLAPFLNPAARPVLHVATMRGAERRTLRLRAGDLSAKWERPGSLDVQVQWVGIDPFFRSATVQTATAWPAVDMEGRYYNRSHSWSYPVVVGAGAAHAVNAGSRPAHWTARIFGPITSPRLAHEQSGQQVALSTLIVGAGEYVTVDSETRTVHLGGDPAASRYSKVNFALTRWWQLQPGANTVRLFSAAFTPPAQAELTWRHTWL